MNNKHNFTIIIPSRFASNRLPGKPLINIHGKPMIIRVIEKAQLSNATRIIVATDHNKIFDIVKQYSNVEVYMTQNTHTSGTERIAEIVKILKFSNEEIIVNLQGDEPLMSPNFINKIADTLITNNYHMVTLASIINNSKEIFDPNIVKIVVDKSNNVLYFSRSPIPWQRDNSNIKNSKIKKYFLHHIGIYAYRAKFIQQYTKWKKSPLEDIEKLEQLRVLWNERKIHVVITSKKPTKSVDNLDDLEIVKKLFHI